MKLAKTQIEHIAKLARLKLTAKEKEKFSQELSSILEYVSQLGQVDTKKLGVTGQVMGLSNVVREDQAGPEDSGQVKRLVAEAPGKQGKFVKVKGVFE